MQVQNNLQSQFTANFSSSIRKISAQTSQRISSLRFLMTVLVVFIHNDFTAEGILNAAAENGSEILPFSNGFFGIWLQRFISEGIATSAVPLFFLFAAYLQFMKSDKFTVLLKKRTKSLLTPFFLWPVLNIALFCATKILVSKFMPQLLSNPRFIPMSEWTAADYFHAFFGYTSLKEYHNFADSYLIQLWFVRDLFILILLSPLLHLAQRKFPFCTLFLASFFYFGDVRPFFVSCQALFYYTLGLYWAEYDFNLFSFADKLKWKALVPLYIVLWLYRWNFAQKFSFPYWTMVFAGCFLFLKISAFLIKNEKIFAALKYLAGFSFYLYAIHMPFLLGCVRTLWTKILPMTSTARCLAEYFGVSALVVLLGTLSGIILKKICPPLFKILSGGR